MTLSEVARKLNLTVATSTGDLDAPVTGGYASDLLSCVMAKARKGNIWVTLQSHLNIVAVAALLQLAAIIVTEGMTPDEPTLQKANEEGIPILTTPVSSFTIVSWLTHLGIRGVDDTGDSWDKMTGE